MTLEEEIKQLIVTYLELEDITPEEIDDELPLFGDGLGLDSIDALELGMAIHNTYGVKLDAEDESTRAHFQHVKSLADFVRTHRT
ncbi:MAG: acyl carrier protein [Deltaproteobacteria bacterium]|nr:MAG: acyl carrier protein [Deltaproteobacteria bacterium]